MMAIPHFPCARLLCLALVLVPPAAVLAAAPREDAEYRKKAALQIDRHVADWYRRQKMKVPAVTDDSKFLRRAFLVTAGRIPTAEEARSFLEIDDPTKREQLAAYLLESPGYSSHMANWAFDLLRVTDGKAGSNASFEPYRHWVRTAIDRNMPWNEFVSKLLASKGDGWSPETAAVGYYTRDRGMPLDNLANSMRVFLGSRMECAQCHDDPYGEQTERHEFFELAAFTHGQEPVRQQHMEPLWSELRESEKFNSIDYRVAQVMWDRVYGMSLGGGGKGRIELPADYQYRDGEPGEMVGGRTPFGKIVRTSDRDDAGDGRQQFAQWVTAKTGEQFASVIANRMWKRVMGKGIYEPADEYVKSQDTHHPELMSFLTQLMVAFEYDLKAFQHVLLLTRTFQFETNPEASSVPTGDDFHGRQVARLSAEQIWDSLVTLVAGDPDKMPRRTLDDRIYVGGRPVLAGRKNMVELSKEVLALDSEAEVRGYFRKLLEDVQKGGGGGDASMMSSNQVRTYGRDAMVRASELPSPAPREHFLYLFGQSDREITEGASREPNVGQVLSLMNGFVQDKLVHNPKAHVYRSLEGAGSEEEKIRRIYIAILNRPPDAEEMKWMREEIEQAGGSAYGNIVAALVMSSEFLFLQ